MGSSHGFAGSCSCGKRGFSSHFLSVEVVCYWEKNRYRTQKEKKPISSYLCVMRNNNNNNNDKQHQKTVIVPITDKYEVVQSNLQ